jgi:hypothetical protein
LNASDTVSLKVFLKVRPVRLSGISVTVPQLVEALARTGFYERASSPSGGVFITPEELLRRLHGRATDALEAVPGLQLDESNARNGRTPIVTRAGAFFGTKRSRLRLAPYCVPAIYIDGAVAQSGDADPSHYFQFDSIEPSSLLGIEIYRSPSEVPARYTGDTAACGVIVVWTR